MAPQHPIFNTPLKVDIRTQDVDTPKNYENYPEGESLTKTIPVWRIANKEFPGVDYGVVANPNNFDDVPDAEIIASGLNSKGPRSVAIGRHGNFLLWGFAAGPTEMTLEAQKCFTNAICYIQKFDHQPPAVRVQVPNRQFAIAVTVWAKKYAPMLASHFPRELRLQLGDDAINFRTYVEENLPYLRGEQQPVTEQGATRMSPVFAADPDVVQLGIPNNDRKLLDRCCELLDDAERSALAQRVLQRYTDQKLTSPAAWRKWLSENRDRLCFSDVAGYRFVVLPKAPTSAPTSMPATRPTAP